MQQASLLIRQSCIGKAKVSTDIVEQIASGNAPDEKPAKCYIHCVLEMSNAVSVLSTSVVL